MGDFCPPARGVAPPWRKFMDEPDVLRELTDVAYPLGQILLDPNNPRLLGRDNYAGVPEQRVAEPGVQRATLTKLNDGPFDMESLRGSIESSGLMLVDRIVVRPV